MPPPGLILDGTFRPERLTGTGGDDTISGGEGADTLNGTAGNDLIYGFGTADVSANSGAIAATRVAVGLDRPLFAASPPGDPGRLFVVEQHTGQIRILDLATGQLNATPFLDLPDGTLTTGNEQGLLGLAFDPGYETNGRFYVNYTDAAGDTRIAAYTRSSNPDIADPASAKAILSFDQPFANHNGGWMGFGPDGLLYIASGDGGSGGDPNNNAQNTDSMLGKILRIDISSDAFPTDAARNYAIPTGNPFAAGPGADEVFAYGLRNPWRISFDTNGDLWFGDVGQGQREEINFVASGELAGTNFGWRVLEGTLPFPPFPGNPDPSDPSLYAPLLEYNHERTPNGGYSVTGGYVYQGPGGATGNYFFADYVTGNIWTVRQDSGAPINFENRNSQIVTDFGGINLIASFAVDGTGRLYVIGLDGEIHRLTPWAGAGDSGDRLLGGQGDDTIYGGAGGDTLDGGPGSDRMGGGLGDDTYYADASTDIVVEGPQRGFDRVLTTASFALGPDIAIEILRALDLSGSAPLNLTGNDFAQEIQGNAGVNVLQGRGGADKLYGHAGRDFISPGNDTALDLVFYDTPPDSTGANRDEISNFDLHEDKFVIPGKVGAVLASITIGALDQSSFDADLAAAVDPAFTEGGAIEAILFDPSSGNQDVPGHLYLVVDLDNDGVYLRVADLVLELVNPSGTLDANDFL